MPDSTIPVTNTGPVGTNSPTSYSYGTDQNPVVPTSIPATIVTSGLSRTNYNNNVDSLNQANANLRMTAPNNPSIVDMLNLNNMPSDFASRAKMAQKQGIDNYVGSAQQNTQLLNTLRTSSNGIGASSNIVDNKTPETSTSNISKVTPVSTTTNNDGSSTIIQSDGSSMIQYQDGTSYKLPPGLDPATGKLQSDNIRAMSKVADDAKLTIDKATATLADDPAAAQAAADIKSKFDRLIQQMQDKNALLAGSYALNSARSGMLQYANEMDTNFKSYEMDRATQRIADLVTAENAAISRSNAAYKSGDVKALDAAQKEYQTALNNKQKEIMDFAKLVNDTVKQNALDLKNAETAQHNATLDSLKVSTGVARDVATQIAGIKDKATIDKIIADHATKLGITNPMILKSAVEKEQSKIQKEDLTIAQKKKTLSKPISSKTYAGFTNKPTAAAITKVNSYVQSIGGNKAAIDKVNSDETLFYKTLNAIPKVTKNTPVVPQ